MKSQVKRKITNNDFEAMLQMYHKGYTFRDIGKTLGRQHSTITKHLRINGVLGNQIQLKHSRVGEQKRKLIADNISKSKLNKNPIRRDLENCILCLSKIGFGKRVTARVLNIDSHVVSNVFRKYRQSGQNRLYVKFKNNTTEAIQKKINQRIARSHRGRVRDLLKLKGINKVFSSTKLLGCNLDFFRKHIESQFSSKMNWGNYGRVWHLDHIIPCAKFDLTKDNELRKCFHYNNYRPLLAKKNIRDNARRGIHQQELLML